MPKDWKRYEAEIRRLYKDEGKTLKEVRRILSDDCGFNASVRAYRMRLEDWGLQKNNSSKSLVRNSTHRAANRPHTTPKESRYLSADYEVLLDAEPDQLELSAPRTTIDGASTDSLEPSLITSQGKWMHMKFHDLKAMLAEWKSDGIHLKEALGMLSRNPSWVGMRSTVSAAETFRLIEEMLADEEIVPLMKACLEASLKMFELHWQHDGWWLGWFDPSSGASWSAARGILVILYKKCYIRSFLDDHFFRDIFTVIAERLLRIYMNRLEFLRARIEPLQQWEVEEAASLRGAYMDILNETTHIKIQDALCNTYSLQIAEWNKAAATQETIPFKDWRTPQASTPADVTVPSNTQGILMLPLKGTEGECRAAALEPLSPGTETVPSILMTEILTSILELWRSGLGEGLAESIELICHNRRTLQAAFGYFGNQDDNLFDILLHLVTRSEQVPFCKHLLVACWSFTENQQDLGILTEPLGWFHGMNRSKTLEQLEHRLRDYRPDKIWGYMTFRAAEIFIGCTSIVAGERILAGLEGRMEKGFKHGFLRDQTVDYRLCRQEYFAILVFFKGKSLEADRYWLDFALKIRSWEMDVDDYGPDISQSYKGYCVPLGRL